MSRPLPIAILAGTDRRRRPRWKRIADSPHLFGYKGALPIGQGRFLVSELVSRLRASGWFDPILLVGPRRVYEGKADCEIVHVSGRFLRTLRAAVRAAWQRAGPDGLCAFISCDVLPAPAEIDELLRASFAPTADRTDFWGTMVEASREEMGASGWKPRYMLKPSPDQPPRPYYPGHLVIARPSHLRLPLVFRMFDVAYRSRNLPIEQRKRSFLSEIFGSLVTQDFKNLFVLKAPILTYTVVRHGLHAYKLLKRQELTLAEFEAGVEGIFVKRRYQPSASPSTRLACPVGEGSVRESAARRVTIAPTRILSLALDIDTEGELQQAARQLASTSTGSRAD